MPGPNPLSAKRARLRGVTAEELLHVVNQEILPALDELRQKYNIHDHAGTGGGAVITAAITADQNNWSPADGATSAIIRVSSDALRNVSGFAAALFASPYDRKMLVNVGVNDVVLLHDDAASLAANRILIPGAADLPLLADESVDLWYDVTTGRLRVV